MEGWTIHDKYCYQNIQEQIEKLEDWRLGFGEKKKVRLVCFSDRHIGYATGLFEYFLHFVDVKAYQFQTYEQWEAAQKENPFVPDVFLFAGILKNRNGYRALEEAKQKNPRLVTVMLELLDPYVLEEMERYQIRNLFEMYLPVEQIAAYLKTKCKMADRVIPSGEGEELWKKAQEHMDSLQEQLRTFQVYKRRP